MSILQKIRDMFAISFEPTANVLNVVTPVHTGWWGGDKYPGSLPDLKILDLDYFALRTRSEEVFETNLYGRGIIRRLLTNVVNTGLTLEATPSGPLIGLSGDELNEWSESIETTFQIWANNKLLCDHYREQTYAQIQYDAYQSALVSGDVLWVLRENEIGLPAVQLIDGAFVQTPLDIPKGVNILNGVEYDAKNRIVAYWITQETKIEEDQKVVRLSAFGKRSGRRLAWLQFGTDKRLGSNRGTPLFTILLQSLSELDKYKDAELRAAVINASVAMTVTKDLGAGLGSAPLSGGAVQRGDVSTTGPSNEARKFSLASMIPGFTAEELAPGELIVSHNTSRPNVNFKTFETAIVDAMAWAIEVPPSIMRLAFSSNYSASRGEVNEMIMFLDRVRGDIASQSLKYVYEAWLVDSALQRRVTAPGLLDAWRDSAKYELYGAWVGSCWRSAIKPSVDLLKETNGYIAQLKEGLITHEKAARELNGSNFYLNVARLKVENKRLAEANQPIVDQENAAPIENDDDDEDDK